MRPDHFFYIMLLTGALLAGCNTDNQRSANDDGWLTSIEDERERIDAIQRQFRGFDMAMVETGYRYVELYWAGQDENWDYAVYQLEKMRLAIEDGLERRPPRAASAQPFLHNVLPEMEEALEAEDIEVFNEKFNILTQECNACHSAEQVPYFEVHPPEQRLSPIQLKQD
jgi:cytochrome c556